MRKLFSSASLLVMFCTALAMAPSAEGKYVSHGRGQWVQASFESIDPAGCIVTRVFLIINGSRFKDSSALSQVSIDRFDRCNDNQSLVSAYGFDFPAADDFELPNGSLSSASIETTMTDVWDAVSETVLTVSIDVDWTATGPATRSTQVYHFQAPGYRSRTSYTGTQRPALASGVVTFGTGNLTPAPTDSAVIAQVQEGTVIID